MATTSKMNIQRGILPDADPVLWFDVEGVGRLDAEGVVGDIQTTVIGDDGFVYRSPMRTAVASYIKLNYFTDADVSAYETAEDMGALYDFYQTAFNTMDELAFTKAGYDTAIRIAREAFDVMKERSSPIAKLSFVVEKIFEYLMNPEEAAHAPEINEKLIDALHILREEEKKEDTANKLTMFAKK